MLHYRCGCNIEMSHDPLAFYVLVLSVKMKCAIIHGNVTIEMLHLLVQCYILRVSVKSKMLHFMC